MNTLFQISITCGWSLFTKVFPSIKARSASGRKSICISEHGPQGPVSPISQKLSFLFPFKILSSVMNNFQLSKASWSKAKPSFASPSKTVTYNLSLGNLYTSTNNSQAHSMASFLK